MALWRALVGIYLAVLVPSWFVMGWSPGDPDVPEDRLLIELSARSADGERTETSRAVRVAYREFDGPGHGNSTLVLLHGSPGTVGDYRDLAILLAQGHRVVVPDLPGFGASTRKVPDYSVRAHAGYVLELMDELGVQSAHFVGFSMGGGVALELAARARERVESITLLASIGVEELELLGNHSLNHGLHGLQLAGLKAARWLVPHFGALDSSMLSVEYARNFYDTDQRRLRPILEALEVPTLILHGEDDFLVPLAAAEEHARIVPQAELVIYPSPASHFLPWKPRDPAAPQTYTDVAERILTLVASAESGVAPTRGRAEAQRIARADAPFDASRIPPFAGPALLAVLALLAVSTFVSEDLACIGAGLLVADGRLGFIAASLACFVGIYVGDMLLYLAGRTFGRPALKRRPMSWFVTESGVERASRWFQRKGMGVIFLSRFTPGLRLPTYVAAGLLRTSFRTFALFFAIAGILWTPALVGIAAIAGERLAETIGGLGARQLPWVIALVAFLYQAYRVLPLLFTHRGRRLLRGRLRRLTSWEFWPPWITYLPIVPWIVFLALRHRGLTKVTACNPAMPAGGFVGESKNEILLGLGKDTPEVPAFLLLSPLESAAARVERACAFVAEAGPASLPVILKPDAGQRGSGVARIQTGDELESRARDVDHDTLLQACIDGEEFGVFYVREPGTDKGRVFGVTVKVLPTVTGDGTRTMEELLLEDARACALHRTYLEELGSRADDVLPAGQVAPLVHVGTHSRGAVFLEGEHLITPELESTIDRIAKGYEGFDFGRFDIRAPSAAHLARGEGMSILEANGVTSEATNVYDPKHSIVSAYRILFEQWSIAYRIGAANADRGIPTTSLLGILRAWWSYRRAQRSHRAHAQPKPTPQ